MLVKTACYPGKEKKAVQSKNVGLNSSFVTYWLSGFCLRGSNLNLSFSTK